MTSTSSASTLRPAEAEHTATSDAPFDSATGVQLLDPSGARQRNDRNEPYQALVEGLSLDELQQFYRDMAIMRRLDAEGTALQRQGQLALWVPSVGQEAAQVGAGRATRPQDWVMPSYREHVIGMIRGVDFVDMLDMLRGNTHGGWDWQRTHFHLYTLVIGTQSLHGTGYAQGVALDGLVGTGDIDRDTAVLTCFGDGATSEGDVSEAMIFAESLHVPEVFLCQNNQWAISVPVGIQAARPLADRAAGFGLNAVRIDGNDVLASYAVARSLLDDARSGEGPGFIEAVTFRRGPHTTSDDPTKYRTRELEACWADRDPITRYETWLRTDRDVPQSFFDEVEQQAGDEAARVREAVLHLPEPEPASMFAHVYSEPHPVMQAQAAWLADYEAGFADEEEQA
ncbi:pyruvate dehydrogenase (acetyl-transferring) E1 component subunit alpha [Pseudoclavibacter sp. CFCC 13796]|uniref:thiamine pyrophosphate-dependent enzyme n=1 Tax=Pseudoclavibacter sp. CFCC 13796 TaxID=2615179 RepID=UPI001300CA75|nr:thiamine pyrophosphate-dependent enzyme [Pseudoclavibacter sp. CFCC 13796]KAB1660883.1 pyruvate dehydrogenase (acetyl-transferring) E1 component subunit alpha [Pseudoclavibacter sp. CFCC 13796]